MRQNQRDRELDQLYRNLHLPHRVVRQWVLSFPYPLRFVLANHPQVMGKVLAIVNCAISTYLRGPT
jgi:hypothetical protein